MESGPGPARRSSRLLSHQYKVVLNSAMDQVFDELGSWYGQRVPIHIIGAPCWVWNTALGSPATAGAQIHFPVSRNHNASMGAYGKHDVSAAATRSRPASPIGCERWKAFLQTAIQCVYSWRATGIKGRVKGWIGQSSIHIAQLGTVWIAIWVDGRRWIGPRKGSISPPLLGQSQPHFKQPHHPDCQTIGPAHGVGYVIPGQALQVKDIILPAQPRDTRPTL